MGGAAEAIAPLVKFPMLKRIALPGLIMALWLFPLIELPSDLFPKAPSDELRRTILLSLVIGTIVAILALGVVVSGLRGLTYQVYEGRAFWPRWLFSKLCKCQQSRVARLLKEQKKPGVDPVRYKRIWARLRSYPVADGGDPHATRPTLLGNILASYEQYPLSRYGMRSVFYWPRIWMQLENQKKDEIDSSWSTADGLLSASAVTYLGGFSWLFAALIGAVGLKIPYLRCPFKSHSLTSVSGLGLLIMGYCIYCISLDFHRANGEMFKSVFDLYRDRLTTMWPLAAKEKTKWEEAWAYLQYFQVPCKACREWVSAGAEYCSKCKRDNEGST